MDKYFCGLRRCFKHRQLAELNSRSSFKRQECSSNSTIRARASLINKYMFIVSGMQLFVSYLYRCIIFILPATRLQLVSRLLRFSNTVLILPIFWSDSHCSVCSHSTCQSRSASWPPPPAARQAASRAPPLVLRRGRRRHRCLQRWPRRPAPAATLRVMCG